MISQRRLIHKYIILDLTLRALEKDRTQLVNFKMQHAFEEWFDTKMNEAHAELLAAKKELGKHGIKIQSEKRINEFKTDYTIVEKGAVHVLNYSNVALKNWTGEEVKRLLNLPYKESELRK